MNNLTPNMNTGNKIVHLGGGYDWTTPRDADERRIWVAKMLSDKHLETSKGKKS